MLTVLVAREMAVYRRRRERSLSGKSSLLAFTITTWSNSKPFAKGKASKMLPELGSVSLSPIRAGESSPSN